MESTSSNSVFLGLRMSDRPYNRVLFNVNLESSLAESGLAESAAVQFQLSAPRSSLGKICLCFVDEAVLLLIRPVPFVSLIIITRSLCLPRSSP